MPPAWLSLLALLAAAPASSAADWPQWRGPNRDGKSPETGLLHALPEGGPKLAWKRESLDEIGTGYGSPAVVGGRLYLIGGSTAKVGAEESVHCLDAATGEPVWTAKLKTSPGKFLDGWGGGPRSTPTVAGDRLYVLGATGDLTCLTVADGKEVWAKNLVKDFGGKVPQWGYSESPLVDGARVVVTPGGKKGVVALDAKTGETAWVTEKLGDDAGYSSLVVAEVGGVRQYVTQTAAHGVGVRASDGKLLWSVGEIGRKIAVIPTPVVAGDLVFFTAGYGAGCELYKLEPEGDGTKATKVYSKNKVVATHHGGVVEYEGKIYGHSDSSGWVCFDYKTGPDEPVWSSKKLDKGSITYADGHFYCYGESKGTLVQIKATPEGWQEVGRFTIPKLSPTRPGQGKVWTHPVVAGGKLYLRDYEHLYCYDIGSPKASR